MSYAVEGVTELLEINVQDKIATLTLNRPQVLNALNHEQRANLEAAFRALDADENVRVIVLRGNGRAFCAGQDQKESASMDADGAHRRIEGYASLYTLMRSLSKPIIARIHGYATGAGLQLALLSDLRIASDDAKIGMTELNVGSAAIMGSAFLLPLIGEAEMRRLVMLSEFVPAEKAMTMKLLHEVLPADALDARVAEIATRMAGWPPLGIALTKEWWRKMGDELFFAAMDQARESHARNFAAGGLSHGAKKFLERERS
ncbi:enoyl-CoA hydratase/isomerase family protein [Paracandidimonas soli]|uniref:Enoyl-CoA hydratase/2-(1,2-epoxy-1,2-dihydrophenyl)acetyl-CoA isomerase n=1 Tax=Paracandidimonas soli TaxID=1917182 RepID=A0A4R3VBH3_9BURK|nr:enoyl-CoA hydratase/isomerase family protein [Paracandidimonas soli]TCV02627.1 enoyl-CoA hydratase/2-(1,2-epoxy-1,2-dihydrophenyl)acetyl-CoA isomerase [Paracandidimonas soli]